MCLGRRSGRTRGQSRRCRSLLDKLKKDQAQALQQHRFPATTCPICLEDIQAPRGSQQDGGGASASDGAQAGPSSAANRASSGGGASGSGSGPSAPLLGGDKGKGDGCVPASSSNPPPPSGGCWGIISPLGGPSAQCEARCMPCHARLLGKAAHVPLFPATHESEFAHLCEHNCSMAPAGKEQGKYGSLASAWTFRSPMLPWKMCLEAGPAPIHPPFHPCCPVLTAQPPLMKTSSPLCVHSHWWFQRFCCKGSNHHLMSGSCNLIHEWVITWTMPCMHLDMFLSGYPSSLPSQDQACLAQTHHLHVASAVRMRFCGVRSSMCHSLLMLSHHSPS